MTKCELKNINYFLLDMDGTVYLGNKLIVGATDFLELIKKQGKDFCFLTNNSSRSAEAYMEKLKKLGIQAERNNLITSTDILIHYLNGIKPGAVIYPVGTEQFECELADAGFELIKRYDVNTNIDYVVIGFDTSLTYKKLFESSRYIRNGTPYIATHPDLNCPLEDGVYMPDCGAIIEFIKASTGISPSEIAGKPNTMVIDMLSSRGLKKNEIAIIGDRLYTDIALGYKGNITSVLVLSGETASEDVSLSPLKPDYIFNSIRDIFKELSGI